MTRLRRLLVGGTLVGTLLGGRQQVAEAQGEKLACLIVLGSGCFVTAGACDEAGLPKSLCSKVFTQCAKFITNFGLS